MDERKRSSIQLKPLVQAQLARSRAPAFRIHLPPLAGGRAVCRCRW